MPVYVDTLLIINSFVNYLMLVCSMKYLNIFANRFRLALASFFGSLFSLKIFLPEIPVPFELVLRCLACSAVVFVAFGKNHIKTFLKNTCVFFTVNLLFGGLMTAFFLFADTGIMIYKNGAVYFNIDLKILTVTSVASFAVINAINIIIAKKAPSQSIFHVTVEYKNRSVEGRGFIDTGNNLRDVFSGCPVIVAQLNTVKPILPDEITEYINGKYPSCSTGEIRLIPVCTVGNDSILPGFMPDRIIVKNIKGEKILKDVYIGVSRRNFLGGEYEFLLYNDLTEEYPDENYQKNTKEIKKKKQNLLHKRS